MICGKTVNNEDGVNRPLYSNRSLGQIRRSDSEINRSLGAGWPREAQIER